MPQAGVAGLRRLAALHAPLHRLTAPSTWAKARATPAGQHRAPGAAAGARAWLFASGRDGSWPRQLPARNRAWASDGRRCIGTTTMQEVPMEELLQAADVIKIRKELSLQPGQKLSVLEFCTLCAKHGLQEPAALALLQHMHKAGIVLHFASSSSQQLKEVVFIKPQDVLDTVWATLDVSGVTNLAELNKKLAELEALEKEFAALTTAKSVLDSAADKEASRTIWLAGALPVGTLAVLFRMTYWWGEVKHEQSTHTHTHTHTYTHTHTHTQGIFLGHR